MKIRVLHMFPMHSNVGWQQYGFCWYPEDRVPTHTSSKSRQGVGCASTCCHIHCSFGPHLPAEVGFGTTTCHVAPDLASLLW
jgi:hypothetical protein